MKQERTDSGETSFIKRKLSLCGEDIHVHISLLVHVVPMVSTKERGSNGHGKIIYWIQSFTTTVEPLYNGHHWDQQTCPFNGGPLLWGHLTV